MDPGQQLSHYTIVSKIGEGGMGAVYRAIDTRLNRSLAIKILPPHASASADRQRRFLQEAQSASSLNHPNIVSIYEIDRADGVDFIAMELVDGQPLDRAIAESPLPLDRALEYATQITGALAAAHQAGIVHRDVKPANILVGRTGHVTVLDFGLAKLMYTSSSDTFSPTQDASPVTASGVIVGTAAYMSPEQAEGRAIDARSDVFSFGAVLYEMLTGQRAFRGRSVLSTLAAVLHEQPTPVRELRADVPAAVDRIVTRCLEKDPERRYATAAELHEELKACRAALGAPLAKRSRVSAPMIAGLAVLVLAGVAAVTWLIVRNSRTRWARTTALPQIEQLVREGKPDDAFRLLEQISAVIPDDPQLVRLRNDVTDPAVIQTEPEGAEVWSKSYLNPADAWIPLGRTPLQDVPVPFGFRRWRVVKEGYDDRELAAGPRLSGVTLTRKGQAPAGMVLVPSNGQSAVDPPAPLPPFWIDRYEVTNREFKRFVDAGGYTNAAYWKQPFLQNGRELSRDDAMRQFRDATGRPGPARWELSTYPEGQADLPVTGVSWFEAAAYAEYAGKSLPSYWHWFHAAAHSIYSDVLLVSNFSGKQLAPVGSYHGLGAYGTFDMAGNAKEWCFNATGTRRFILGGAWNEPSYMYTDRDAQDPFARQANFGFRLAKYPEPLATALTAPVERTGRDYTKERPAADDAFAIFRGLYAYDREPLNAQVEAMPEESPLWTREKITIDAAYGKERVPAFLFVPRNVKPPYQTVMYFPSGQAFSLQATRYLDTRQVQFLIQSGRAVLFPVYRGTYDRWIEIRGPRDDRDVMIDCVKDFERWMDYLQTRPDIDKRRIGYYGVSSGAVIAPMILAVEPRVAAAALMGGAFPLTPQPPEVDPINFAPRVTIPVLMLNGRYDFVEPVETAQKPMFQAFGTPPEHKRHAIFESGHAIITVQPLIGEVLDWFDKYLGPVDGQVTKH